MNDPNTDARNIQYEDTFLDQLIKDAHRRYGVNAEPFVEAIRERLRIGSERYGDAFLRQDNHDEIADEVPDVVGYALLEIQRIQHHNLNVQDGVYHHLYEAALAASIADYHARRARYLARTGR